MNTSAPVDRRVRRQALIMAAVAAAMLVLVGLEMVRGTLGPPGAASGFLGGLAVGFAASRIQRFDWDDRAGQVIGHVDRLGVVVLIGLVVATLAQEWVLGHWATGATLTALGVSASAGTFAGRALGTRRRVRSALRHDGPDS